METPFSVYWVSESIPDSTDFIHPSAADSLFLRDWEGDDEVVLLAPPSSSSLGSVFISGFLSSTSIGSGFSSGSSFFTSVDTESSSVYRQKSKWLIVTQKYIFLCVCLVRFVPCSLTFSHWQSDQLSSQNLMMKGCDYMYITKLLYTKYYTTINFLSLFWWRNLS